MPVVDTPTVAVAVIGAGVAGLAAARELGRVFPDVVLLEASDRLGGRVKQVRETEGEKRRGRRESAVEIKTNDDVFDPSPPPPPPPPPLQIEGLAPWPVELGAEFVHGRESSLVVRSSRVPFRGEKKGGELMLKRLPIPPPPRPHSRPS